MEPALWTVVVLPALAGAALLVAGRKADRVASPLAVAVALLMVAAGAMAAVSGPVAAAPALAGVPIGLAVDGLSGVAVVTVVAVLLAVVVFSAGEFGRGDARARFHGLLLLFAAAMVVTVTATDLLALLAAWEVMGATSYALIGFWWPDSARVRSATLAFVTTRAGDLGMYLAAGAALAGGAAALDLAGLPELRGVWRDVAVAGLIGAALGKSAQLPFSFWLSHAMAGPVPVSAMLHSATMVAAGGYLLLRIEPALSAVGWAGSVVAWIGALTALLLGVVAYAQRDLKQLLAASTSAQIGFVVLAAGVGSVAGGAAQFVAHAAVKSLLFLAAGVWLLSLGARDLVELASVARRHPLVGVSFAAGALALGGLPPLSIWAAKDKVLSAALPGAPALYAVGLVASVAGAAYAARALGSVWGWAATRTGRGPPDRRPPAALWLPLPVLAAAAVALGALALPVLSRGWSALLGLPPEPHPAGWEMALSGGLGAVVLALLGYYHARVPATAVTAASWAVWPRDWLRLERIARTGLVRPTLAVATALAAFDDRVVAAGVRAGGGLAVRLARLTDDRAERHLDGAVRAGALLGMRLGRLTDLPVEALLDRVVRAVAAGARFLGRLARRPQTGLLHQYYAQAIALLVLLAAVFLLVR